MKKNNNIFSQCASYDVEEKKYNENKECMKKFYKIFRYKSRDNMLICFKKLFVENSSYEFSDLFRHERKLLNY